MPRKGPEGPRSSGDRLHGEKVSMIDFKAALDEVLELITQHEPEGPEQIAAFTQLAGRLQEANDAWDAIEQLRPTATEAEANSALLIAQNIYNDLKSAYRAAQKTIRGEQI